MRRLLFILFLLPMLGFSQALQRQFFTTNNQPDVRVVAGTNAFITFSLIGQQRTYRVDTPASGTATNIVWPVQGTNVYLTTNGLAIVIDVPSPLIPWQAITNITSIQIPAAAITNAPWSVAGQTNLELTVAGTNVFVTAVTNLGVTTFTIDVPTQPQQTNWSLSSITNANYLTNWATINTNLLNDLDQTNWPWQSITNISTVQIPYSAITNPPAAGGQTNLALVVAGTNTFVTPVTNLGVTTFTVDGPAVRTNWAITDITNSLNLTNWALLGTNLFLPVAGGTSTGPQVSTSATTNAPANDEFVTGGWVRNLFNVGVSYFSSTNIQVGATNADSPNQLVYQFQSTIPQVAARSYTTSDFLTNNGYLGSVVTTNTFLQLGGQVVVNAYLAYTGGASAPTVTLHPELYYSYDRTNWLGDWVAQGHTLTTGTTNLHQWVIDFQPTTSTNSTGFYVQRRYRCDGISGAGVRTLWFLIGTNSASGTNDSSHITVPVPSTSSLVYASNVVSGGQIPIPAVPTTLTNLELFSVSSPALKLHGGFLSTNDTFGSIALQTNGTLQLSNASVAAVVGISNILQIDGVVYKKAIQVDTNGMLYPTNGIWIQDDLADKKFRVGNTAPSSTGVAVSIARLMSGGSGNGHGVSDETFFRRNGAAYAAFDAWNLIGGSGNNFDHIVAFQARHGFNAGAQANTVNNFYSFLSFPANNGTATKAYHFKSTAITGTGILQSLYGLYIDSETNTPTVENYGICVLNGSNLLSGNTLIGGSLQLTNGLIVATNAATGGSWKSPTNAPSDAQVLTATGTGGDSAWITPSGAGATNMVSGWANPTFTATPRYSSVNGSQNSGSEGGTQAPFPACALVGLYMKSTAIGAGTNMTCVVMTNGIASNLSLSIIGNGGVQFASVSGFTPVPDMCTLSMRFSGDNASAYSSSMAWTLLIKR